MDNNNSLPQTRESVDGEQAPRGAQAPGGEQTPIKKDLIGIVLESHRRLAQLHDEEIIEMQNRLFHLRTFLESANATAEDMRQTHERFRNLVEAWESKKDQFADTFYRNTTEVFQEYKGNQEKRMQEYREQPEKAEQEILHALSGSINKIVSEATQHLKKNVGAMKEMVETNSDNLAHDLEALHKAVSRQQEQWKSRTGRHLAWVLFFTLIGSTAGTFLGFLFLLHH